MPFIFLPIQYLSWHYTTALKDLLNIIRDFLWFIGHLFSLSELGRTFFSPWRRLGEQYRGGFSPQAWLETFILNSVMRLIGIIFRLILLISGLIVLLLVLILTPIVFIFWLILPWLVIFSFILGLNLLLR